MFDRTDYPYSETFVREAIQNTLDARFDQSAPALIRFRFHNGNATQCRPYLQEALNYRRQAGLPEIEEWAQGTIRWITIEDFNTRGLDGALHDRLGNFWNYWLNFGVSNKEGAKRGGRGIGRIAFLIASRMQAVLAITRRTSDNITAACGMVLLRTIRTTDGVVRTTHGYLAKNEKDDVFTLHDEPTFLNGLVDVFGLTGYSTSAGESGLALVIPFPYPELTPVGILASSIEHFAPAILSRALVVEVDDTRLDAGSLDAVAASVEASIHSKAIAADVARFIDLVRSGSKPKHELKVDLGTGLEGLRDTPQVKQMQEDCQKGETISVRIVFQLSKGSSAIPVSLHAVIRKTPDEQLPIDRLFREGMSLPEVKASMPGDLDLVILVDDEALAAFLNLCEGKAHLDLLESKEIRAKLEAQGYRSPITIKRFVKDIPSKLRALLTPEIIEPDADVFDTFFALPDSGPDKKKARGGKPDITPPPPPPPPPPRVPSFIVRTLEDGFRLTANPECQEWPINLTVSMAYADGTRSPSWSEYDFGPAELATVASDCRITFSKNKLTARNCGSTCSIEVTGFDTRRELDTNIKVWRDA